VTLLGGKRGAYIGSGFSFTDGQECDFVAVAMSSVTGAVQSRADLCYFVVNFVHILIESVAAATLKNKLVGFLWILRNS
jgi:hypothetical protein